MIPEYKCPSYGELRNRITCDGDEWYNEVMRNVLYQKIYKNREQDTCIDKFKSEFCYYAFKWKGNLVRIKIQAKNIIKFIFRIKRK